MDFERFSDQEPDRRQPKKVWVAKLF